MQMCIEYGKCSSIDTPREESIMKDTRLRDKRNNREKRDKSDQYKSYYITAADLSIKGYDRIPDELVSGKHLIYSSPATLAFNSPGAEGFGVKRAALAIPGSVMLLVAPACCGRNTTIFSEIPGYENRFFYLLMDETDIVTGRHLKKIPDAVAAVCSSLNPAPSVVMICITCVDALLGTDMERVCKKASEAVGIPVLPSYMYALTREGRKPPMVHVRQSLYSLLEKRKRRRTSVNILGYFAPLDDDCELYDLLRQAGVKKIREIGRCRDYSDYMDMSEANFNLVLNPEARYAASDIQKRLGIPYIELARLYRIDQIKKQYTLFAAAIGAQLDDETYYKEAQDAIQAFKDKYPDLTFSIGEGCNANAYELAYALLSYGFRVAEIFADPMQGDFVYIDKIASVSPDTRIYSNLEPSMIYYGLHRNHDRSDEHDACDEHDAHDTCDEHEIRSIFDVHGRHGCLNDPDGRDEHPGPVEYDGCSRDDQGSRGYSDGPGDRNHEGNNDRYNDDLLITVGKDASYYHRDRPNLMWSDDIQPFGYKGVIRFFKECDRILSGQKLAARKAPARDWFTLIKNPGMPSIRHFRKYIAPFAPDQSGAAAVFCELGGMVIILDAGGCAGNICGFDEPRWFDSKSAIFSAGLRDMDAILGRDERLVEKVEQACKKVDCRFVAIIGTPVPSVIGTDYRALGRMIKKKTGLPVLAVDSNGVKDYDDGIRKAIEALFKGFAGKPSDFVKPSESVRPSESEKPFDYRIERTPEDHMDCKLACKPSVAVGILGVTPLDVTTAGPAAAVLQDYYRGKGYAPVYTYGMDSGIDDIIHADRVGENIVIAPAALPAARYLKEKFGSPYRTDYPLETLPAWGEILGHLSDMAGKRILIIHQQMLANALREYIRNPERDVSAERNSIRSADCLNETNESSSSRDRVDEKSDTSSLLNSTEVTVASWFELDQEYKETDDVRVSSEEDMIRLVSEGHYDYIIGDSLFLAALPDYDGVWIDAEHFAVSGRR